MATTPMQQATQRPVGIGLRASAARRLRVLVVDDEPFVRKFMAAVLLREGHQVTEAEDGLDALGRIGTHPEDYDVLVTDITMPRMDGLALAERVRERFPRLPILYVTAQLPEAIKRISARVLRKPFRPQALLSRLREAVAVQ